MWHGGMLAGKNLEFVVFENHLTAGSDDESAVEEFFWELGMLYLSLRDDVGIMLLGFSAQGFGLFSGDVQGHFVHVFLVIPVEHLVGEALQTTLRHADQSHRQINSAEPDGSVDQFRNVFDVDGNFRALPATTHSRLQSKSHILLNHGAPSEI